MIKFSGLSLIMEDFLRDQSWSCDTTRNGTAHLCGIRGAKIRREHGYIAGISVLHNPSRITSRYDDCLFVFGFKKNGSRFSAAYEMSAQPGRPSFFLSYYNSPKKGAPIVQPGQYLYRRGLHKSKYKALRQADAPVVAIRDINQNVKQDPSDLWDYPKYTGINIHAGGRSPYVGYYSSGCQVVRYGWTGKPWREFRHLVYNVASKQNIFNYTLFDGWFFGLWYDADNKDRWKYLWYGSKGKDVKRLQKKLFSLGYNPGKSNGIFSTKTHIAVRKYQRDNRTPETGYVSYYMKKDLGI